jgi:beta-lactamase superfamily II metal-dependent hydrolase
VDGGSSANLLADALGRRLTFGQPEIDYLVVAATGENQIASLPLAMDHFRVRNILWSGPIEGSYSARELQKRLVQDQIPVIEAKQGQKLDLGDGAYLEVISASARGAILLLEWDRFRVLLPIGLDFESQEALLRDARFTPVTALLLAEGGISTLNSKEWMIHWKPQLALLSVAAGNEEGLPHPETLKALDGIPLLRTDQDGWIELSTDGEQLWAEVERK